MSIKEDISSLVAKLPTDLTQDQLETEVTSTLSGILFTGHLLGRRGESSIVLLVGENRLIISEEDILEIRQSASAPAVHSVGVTVDVRVKREAQLTEERFRSAVSFGEHLGKRPFVHELPSEAHLHASTATAYEEQQARWRKTVGLADYPLDSSPTPYLSQAPSVTQTNTSPGDSQTDNQTDYSTDFKTDEDDGIAGLMQSPTPHLTQSNTPFQTSYTSVTQTTTPGDTHADKPLDYKTDQKADFQTDYGNDI